MHKQLAFKYYITQAQPTIMHLVILGVWLSVSLVCLFSSICCPQIAPKLVYSIKSSQIVPRLCGVCCYRYMLQVGAVGPPTPKLACFTHLARTPSSISLLARPEIIMPQLFAIILFLNSFKILLLFPNPLLLFSYYSQQMNEKKELTLVIL